MAIFILLLLALVFLFGTLYAAYAVMVKLSHPWKWPWEL